MKPVRATVMLLATFAAGCGPVASTYDKDGLGACTGGLLQSRIDLNLDLTYAADESLHELVACGQLTVDISAALSSGLMEMVLRGNSREPGGLVYQGGGQYLTAMHEGHRDLEMLVSLFEQRGDELIAIEHDVFARESYLVGVSSHVEGESVDVEVDPDNLLDSEVEATGTLVVQFEAAGPLAHLLGLGDELESPLEFELADFDELKPKVDAIRIRADVSVKDERKGSTIMYDVTTPDMRLIEVATSADVGYNVNDITGTAPARGQEMGLLPDGWDIQFAGGNLDGTVDFRVVGGDFDYTAKFSYDMSPFANVVFTCD
jgi:hypothetical protein